MTKTFAALPEEGVEAMVDLETTGTRPGAAILTIGAVRFMVENQPGPFETFYQAIRLESSLKYGLRVQADTMIWWQHQSKEAQLAAFEDPNAVDLPEALDRFTDWVGSRPDRLYGNSARFDLGILEAAYAVCGKEIPWRHWLEVDYRTLKNLPAVKHIKLKRRGTHHNALDDALSQAIHCRDILANLLPKKPVGDPPAPHIAYVPVPSPLDIDVSNTQFKQE